jgi:N-acetylglucosaminyldiphosphoundecaprenol N-acetyl-beta-D-mannosaminyltransferase
MLKGGIAAGAGLMDGKSLLAESWPAPVAPVIVGGLPVAPLTTRQWVELMLSDHEFVRNRGGAPRYHSAVNGNVLSVNATNAEFSAALREADALAADGVPILFGARLFGRVGIPDRAATTDLFHDLARAAEAEGLSMYFLGGTEKENRAAVAEVRRQYPGLRIAGRHDGYFDIGEEAKLMREITGARTDILWVGLGVPREDIFVVRNRAGLQGVTWIKTCGGLFNFLSGSRSRAPLWMRRSGLEWLYRLALEPRRLFRRYFFTNFHALWLMMRLSRGRT